MCILHTYTQGHDNDFSPVFSREGEFLAMWERIWGGQTNGNYIAKIAACVFHTVYGKIGWEMKKVLCNGKECETIPVIREFVCVEIKHVIPVYIAFTTISRINANAMNDCKEMRNEWNCNALDFYVKNVII